MSSLPVNHLLEIEKKLGLYDIEYQSFPIWRLFRFHTRIRYMKGKVVHFSNQTLKRNWILWLLAMIKKNVLSFLKLIMLLLHSKKYENIFFAFFRLQYVDGYVMDKFTDPVIDNTDLSKNMCIFQQTGRNVYTAKRWNVKHVYESDFLYTLAVISTIIFFPVYVLTSSFQSVFKLYKRAQNDFKLTKKHFIKWQYRFCIFMILSKFYKFIYKHLQVKRIFIVNRATYIPQIIAAHQCGVLVYEFQHGITHGETLLYSGPYDPIIDPDYFLAFGSLWIGPQFSIPEDQIINIGWAYKNVINKIPSLISYAHNTVLIISSPTISKMIVETVFSLANRYKDFQFHIRCHPQEVLSEELQALIKKVNNILIADNKIDSFVALKSYQHIIGEDSSALYEGLSMGKNVGRFCYNGFTPSRLKNIDEDGFYYMYGDDSFLDFIERKDYSSLNHAYSDFKPSVVNSLK